jgi:hypothetical protein
MSNLLKCYGSEQATQYLLSIRYGVSCNKEKFKTEARRAANMMLLSDLSSCGAYLEQIDCFLKNVNYAPCSGITVKDCDDLVVAFVSPTPKPCYLTVNFFD